MLKIITKGKKKKRRNIKNKLIATIVSVCLIPILTVGLFSCLIANKIITEQFESSNLAIVKEINRGIENYLNAMSNSINMLSENYDFTDIEIGGNDKYAKGLLKDVKNSSSQILDIYFALDKENKMILTDGELPLNEFNYKDRAWYNLAKNSKGKVIISEPYQDNTTKDFVITLAKAVYKENVFKGVIGMDVTLKELSKQYSSIVIGETGYICITDNKGIVIAHQDESLIGTDALTKLSFWKKVMDEENGFDRYKYEGIHKFVVYDTNEVANWKILSSIDIIELQSKINRLIYIIVIVATMALVIGVLIAIIISRGFNKNIAKLKESINNASKGELTSIVDISSNDEFEDLGADFNSMLSNVSSLVGRVIESSETILDTSTNLTSMADETTASVSQVSVAIEEITQGATNLAQSSQDSSIAIGRLSEQLDDIAHATDEMGKTSRDTQDLSSQGLSAVNVLILKSNETKSSSMNVAQIVKEVEISAKEINEISDTINQITSQTNLLSLNASIEAARAGEAGKGFAVVAGEIRKLAEQSKSSTENIKRIIDAIQDKISNAVSGINRAETIVIEQEEAVAQTETIFNSIISGISMLTEKVEEINSAIAEMTNNKDNVVQQIENTSSISEETASSTEEVSASAEEITTTMEEFSGHAGELQKLAEKLKEEVNKFKI